MGNHNREDSEAMICPSTGKVQHQSYAKALAALMALRHGLYGHVYVCDGCGAYHISRSTHLTRKSRGRGKRRGAVA
jgi:hypothetical protein